jgi:hypothetical protein
VFGAFVSHVRFVAVGWALTSVCLGQSAAADHRPVLSNIEARQAATSTAEANVPPGYSPTVFTVRISVGADGMVKDVSNPHSLPEPLFAAAAKAARGWIFRSRREGGNKDGFEADITFHGPVTGTVTTKDSKPLAGVLVSASPWTCCPVQRDQMKTDTDGSFHIEHPGAVLHFFPPDGFQPKLLLVPSATSSLLVTLDPVSNSLSVPPCTPPRRGFERVGWGKYGLQFDVPLIEARIIRGKVDTNYVVHTAKPKHGDARVEFWFGPYAMESTPDDAQFLSSEAFATRDVVMPPHLIPASEGGVAGFDSSGRLPNGRMWRQTAILSEGARYRDVSPEEAALFDRIIDSACWIPWPEHR